MMGETNKLVFQGVKTSPQTVSSDGLTPRKRSRNEYTIGWICALPIELAASVGMLDEIHPDLELARGDRNMYTLGSLSGHNVVVACLPAGSTGITPAATVAANMLRSFPSIRFGLMVGIGGGAPRRRARPNEDVRLGDVVVSIPQGELGKNGGSHGDAKRY